MKNRHKGKTGLVETFDRHKFWRDPEVSPKKYLIETCKPEYYLNLVNVTHLVVSTIGRYCDKEMRILEIGCGTGRNLVGLKKYGFKNISGVEISSKAVEIGREYFPEYNEISVIIDPVEDMAKSLPDYDVIFTQGCLMHLSYDLDWVIETIKHQANYMILTNEGEDRHGEHVWARNYKNYITSDDIWRQVEMENGSKYPPLPTTTIKRVFLREENIKEQA